MEYLQQASQVSLAAWFLWTSAKLKTHLSRLWVLDSISSIGVGEPACKWVSLMLQSTSAKAAFKRFQSDQTVTLPVVLAAQSLSSKISSGQSQCQMVSQRLSATNILAGYVLEGSHC